MKKPIKANLHWTEVDELAIHILGLPEDSDNAVIEEALADKFEISHDSFTDIVSLLLPLAMRGRGMVGAYASFAVIEKNGDAMALVKMEVDPDDQQNYK